VQTYYYHIRYEIKQHETETLLLTTVKLIREDLPGIGVPKLLHMLAQKPELRGRCPGRDALYDLLRYHSLLQIHKHEQRMQLVTNTGLAWLKKF